MKSFDKYLTRWSGESSILDRFHRKLVSPGDQYRLSECVDIHLTGNRRELTRHKRNFHYDGN